MPRPNPSWSVALVLAATACSNDKHLLGTREQRPDEEREATVEAGSTEPTVAPPAAVSCEVPEVEDSSPLRPFESLNARVVDQEGLGVANLLAQACGLNVCLYGATDDEGFVVHQRNPAQDMRRAALKYGDGLEYAQFVYVLPDARVHNLGDQATVALPAREKGQPFLPGTALSSGGATLTLSDDAVVSIDLLTFSDVEDHVFLAREMPREVWPPAIAEDLGLGIVVVLAPLKTEFCPPARLEIPNSLGWDPGATLEFLLHVTDVANHWGLYGDFSVVSTGRVSEDGQMLTTDDEGGIPQLGVIGVRLSR